MRGLSDEERTALLESLQPATEDDPFSPSEMLRTCEQIRRTP